MWAILVTVIVNDIVVVTDIHIQNSSSRPKSPTHAACLPDDIDTDIAKLICASFVARAGLNILNVVMLIPFDKLELALYSNWMSMLLMYARTWHCRWMHCAATFGSGLDVVDNVVVGSGIVKARKACEDGKNAAKRVLCFNVITSPDKQTTNVGTCVSQILNDQSLSMPM